MLKEKERGQPTAELLVSPQMRFALLPFCNLKCFYCTPEGEGYAENLNEQMSRDEIIRLAEIAATEGITHIKLTGGEPLMRRDTSSIVEGLSQIQGIVDIQMVTNGTLLERHAQSLRDAGLKSLTVSIDAADPATYLRIRGGRLDMVRRGLDEAHAVGLPIRFNMVLMRTNLTQVDGMMELAREYGASLKLLDVMDLQRESTRGFWEDEFVHFRDVQAMLMEREARFVGYEAASGGVGAPLLDFRMPDGLQVVLKDSTLGAHYHATCFGCRYYPCQDALISLRVTHDGHLKRCLIRNDNLVDVLTPLRQGNMVKVHRLVRASFKILAESTFMPRRWVPSGPKNHDLPVGCDVDAMLRR